MQNLFQDERSISDIFLLIRGLSQSEKAYYKKMAKRHADQNSALHLRLFSLIENNELPDENQLCESLKIENKIHFSGIKSYMYKDVLDTLVFQKRNNCVDTQLYFMLEQISLLQEKNLVHLSEKICKKAILLAEKFQKYHYLILLLHLQNRILEFKNYKQFSDTSRAIFSKLEQAVFLQKACAENRFLYERARALTYRTWLPITSDELIEIRKVGALLGGLKPLDDKQPLISLFYLNTLALCRYMFHETDLCTATCHDMAELWKMHPHLINEYPLLFLNSVNTTCYNNFLCKNIRKANDDIDAYAQLVKTYLAKESYRKHFEIILFNTALKVHLKSAEFGALERLLNEKLATVFECLLPVLSAPEQLSVKCSVCISFFVLEQLDQAEHLLAVIKEQNRAIKRDDILYFCLLFDLVILYEQEKWNQLDSDLKTAYHFLYCRKKLRPFERDLMLFLGRLSDAHSKAAANRLISNFLKMKRAKTDNPDENLYLLYFNYYGWLESKLMKMRYMEYVKQHTCH
ncbi:MAG TPA: hypothetical protein VN726_15775 [Hanamia sp.]|nr:hypothetical protein [Hanamia sp.]